MKKKNVAVTLSGVSLLFWGVSALWPEKHVQTQVAEAEAHLPAAENATSGDIRVRPVPQSSSLQPDHSESRELNDDPEQRLPVEMKTQFAILSKVYATELTYPAYSRPMTAEDKQWLMPNRYTPVKAPVLDGTDSAALVLEKYRHFYPDDINLSVQSGLPVAGMHVELFDIATHERLISKQVQGSHAVLSSGEDWPNEIRVKATVDFSAGTDILTTDFQFFVPVAEVTQVARPVVSGANVDIPVMLTVKQGGIYRVRANLFTMQGQPVAVLTAKQKLAAGEQPITLQAHHQVFTSAGEYELRTFQVEKMSGFPGEKTQYGISQQPSWPLGYIDTSLLTDEPYIPTEAERQRMAFLQNAASG